MIIGTSHFVSFGRAVRYYHDYNPDASQGLAIYKWVEAKLVAGEISVGPPEVKPGERMFVNDEGRYCVERA
tara:strand:+ start:132 stop:344 length:213 start_codon:yes stop_codon:yes gene_type:complete